MSEYPAMCKQKRFPVGPHQRIVKNFGSVSDYFGIMKCQLLPPRKLNLPVIPSRIAGKLMFVLCPKCAVDGVSSAATTDAACPHSNDERVLRGTWCTMEVQKALERGYTMVKIEEVWHWPQSVQGLFADYINLFLKIKTEASGFPTECQTQDEKNEYIHQFEEVEGIKLDKEKIVFNTGLRALAK